jgi:hypothetical protein
MKDKKSYSVKRRLAKELLDELVAAATILLDVELDDIMPKGMDFPCAEEISERIKIGMYRM